MLFLSRLTWICLVNGVKSKCECQLIVHFVENYKIVIYLQAKPGFLQQSSLMSTVSELVRMMLLIGTDDAINRYG